jgi:hypothetical protein
VTLIWMEIGRPSRNSTQFLLLFKFERVSRVVRLMDVRKIRTDIPSFLVHRMLY